MNIRDLFTLENDTAFQQLNQEVNSFNTLKILKLENHEIRHSNILAWLLNPKENHTLRDYFLRKMIEHLILIDENSDNLQYHTVCGILNQSLMESHVYREVKTNQNRYIDLLIVNQQLKTVLLIENKFYSTESAHQLDDYLVFISAKLEKTRYTKFFTQRIDVNMWDNPAELTQAMTVLFNSSEFTLLRKQVAAILNHENPIKEEAAETVESSSFDESKIQIQHAFKNWMEIKNIPETHYRVSSKNLSFKIPLFDAFKEKLGETREKWWWDNGPFLFWMNINPDYLYFTLEVGPIEADKRVMLMENMKEKGIQFTKKGLNLEAKFNKIYSNTKTIEELTETELLNTFNELYDNKNLQIILEKLQMIYDETVSKIE